MLVSGRGDLLFVSTRFLFPVDSGGKIRTTQILRGLKGGDFRIVLASPASNLLTEEYAAELDEVCDEFHWWPEKKRGRLFYYTRMRHLLSPLPIPVRTDRNPAGLALIQDLVADRPSVAVFDFAHAGVLMPSALDCPSVMFTHNVEAEIFRRHCDVAVNPVFRRIWANQYRKMFDFEKRTLERFDVVVAVADRDARQFSEDYGINELAVIPTGVDLEFFGFRLPERTRDVVFLGSMDWMANQEGVTWFMDEVWPRVARSVPDAKMTVVGRAPPPGLIQEAKRRGLNWSFTGFVDDVRPYVQGAAVSVIPLRVGGGTRLKVYEAMAVGSPVVSTAVGVEGLPVQSGCHYVEADSAENFAEGVIALLEDAPQRECMAIEARRFVEQHFSYRVAAGVFQDACHLAISRFAHAAFPTAVRGRA